MSAEHDDQDIELVEHQQFNRGAGLQTYESNVPLNIDQEERMGRKLFSTVMVLSNNDVTGQRHGCHERNHAATATIYAG